MKTLKNTLVSFVATLLLPSIVLAGGPRETSSLGLVRSYAGKYEVITIDRWETQFRAPLEGMMIGETPVSYLRRVLEAKIRPLDSELADQLERSLTQVLTSYWANSLGLMSPREVGAVKGNFKRDLWIPVQLVTGSEGTIQFNKDLFNRLENFDVALVLLDQAIFKLGKNLRSEDAPKVRRITAQLLAKDTLAIDETKLRAKKLDRKIKNRLKDIREVIFQ